MQRLNQVREEYHVSIRREKRQRPLEVARNTFVNDSENFITNNIIYKITSNLINPTPVSIISILKDLQEIDPISLNKNQIISFLTYCLTASWPGPSIRSINLISSQLLNNFLSCHDSIVLSKLDLIYPVLHQTDMMMLFDNLSCLTLWDSNQKSIIMGALCDCLLKQDPIQFYHLQNIYSAINDPVPVSESITYRLLNILSILIDNPRDYDDSQEEHQIIFYCIKALLSLHANSIITFLNHPLYQKLKRQIEYAIIASFENKLEIILLDLIIIIFNSQVQNQFPLRFYEVLKKASMSVTKQAKLGFIKGLTSLVSLGKFQQIVKYKLLDDLVHFLILSSDRWPINFQGIKLMAQIIRQFANHVTKFNPGCLQIFVEALSSNSNQIIEFILDSIGIMIEQQNVILSELILRHKLVQKIEDLAQQKQKIIVDKSLKILSQLQNKSL